MAYNRLFLSLVVKKDAQGPTPTGCRVLCRGWGVLGYFPTQRVGIIFISVTYTGP